MANGKVFMPNWAKLLVNLGRETNYSRIYRDLEITSACAYTLLKDFEELGLITKKINGRNNDIVLTDKGLMVYEGLRKVFVNIGMEDVIISEQE